MYSEFVAIYICFAVVAVMLAAVIVMLSVVIKNQRNGAGGSSRSAGWRAPETASANRNEYAADGGNVAFCKRCGTQFDGSTRVCPRCGLPR